MSSRAQPPLPGPPVAFSMARDEIVLACPSRRVPGVWGFQTGDGVLVTFSRVGVVAKVSVSFVLVEEVAARVAMAGR